MTFTLRDELKTTKASYPYYLKGTDITGSDEDVFFTGTAWLYTFSVVCGTSTFHLDTEPEDTISYEIDNNMPTLRIPLWESYSSDCAILQYELYDTREAEEEGPSDNWNQAYTIDGDHVVFEIASALKTVRDDYAYVLRGSDITESTAVVFTDQYAFSVICGAETFYPTGQQPAVYEYELDNRTPTLLVY